MSADQFGRRFIRQRDFIAYARHLGLRGSFLEDVLEFAERFGILTPAARVRFPDSVVRRWFQQRYPAEQVLEPVELDGPRLSSATALRRLLANDLMRRTVLPGNGEHPLDAVAPEYRSFVATEFSRSTFTPWSTFRAPLAICNSTEIGGAEDVYTYYHAWQVFQLAAFLRSGLSVLYDITSNHTRELLLDLRRDDVRVTVNFDARGELKRLHENAGLFDAVAKFDDLRNRALQVHAGAVDRQSGYLSAAAFRAYQSREVDIARQVIAKEKLSPKTLIAFIQVLCGLWAEARDHYPETVANAFKSTIQSAIELLRLANRRYTIASIIKRVGTFGGFHRPLLEVVFPDWVSEQRDVVEASLGQWIVPRLAQMPPQFVFDAADIVEFCKWIERKGFLQLYWHFRRLTDVGPFDDQIGRSATTVEIIGLASLVEHLATQALADRKPPQQIAGTFRPKLLMLFGPTSTLAVELKNHWGLTQTIKRTLRQQLARIDRMRSVGAETPALKALLRLVLIRNAASHGGLPGFRRDQMQRLVESLLIAALVVWKAR